MRHILAVSVVTSVLACTAALAAPQFSREVGKPLAAAKAESDKGRWDAALNLIKEAEAVKNKSAFEQYQINELKAYVFSKQNNMKGVAEIYEMNLQSGQTPPQMVGTRLKTLAQIYAGQRNDQKAIEFGNRWIKEGGGASDPAAYYLVAQSYYQQKDFRNSVKSVQDGIQLVQRGGKKAPENWLVLQLNGYYALKDDSGVLKTREQMVRTYPNAQNWEHLMDMMSGKVEGDAARLNFYRLMLDLNVLKEPADYVEMAQMMMDKEFGVPAEAVKVIQKGFDNKVLDNKDKERHLRVLTAAKQRDEAARAQLAQQEQAAAAATTGDADVKLGAVYMSYNDNAKAITVIERGIQKGSLHNADEAKLMLGLALLRAGKKDEARKAFAAVSPKSELAKVADLWEIRSQQI